MHCFVLNQSLAQDNVNNSLNERPNFENNPDQLVSQLANCNYWSEITVQNLTQNGPVDSVGCESNDTLEICFKVLYWESGHWLHGLVPDFGDCIDVFPTFNGEPGIITVPMTNNTLGGDWEWFGDGIVLYNDVGNPYYPPDTPVGAGWFYVNNNGGSGCNDTSNPNCTYGDGYISGNFNWEVCFLAVVKCPYPGMIECEIAFRTFGDGETGDWSNGSNPYSCADDSTWVYNFSLPCCEQPIILNEEVDFEVCSGDLFELDLISNMDPETTYQWYVAPNPYGATSGTGSTISDVLTNTTGSPVTVVYYVTPTCLLGCIGEQLIVTVTIFPEIDFYVDPPYTNICPGDCVQLTAVISSGAGPFSCIWSNGIDGPESIVVCNAGYYSVTVTDAYGCTNESGAYVEEVYPPLVNIEASPGAEACENGPDYPITLTANTFGGSGFYYYLWSSGGNDQTELAFESGTYSVTVYDGGFGCYNVVADISITIFPAPQVNISGPTTICANETLVCFTGTPIGGDWGGVADMNGCVHPQNLGVGIHTLSYNFIDLNGCEASVHYDFEIIGAAEQPDQIPDIFLCENGGTEVYVIPEVPFAIDYEWTISGSGTIVSGQGTTSIEVAWQSPGGQVCVRAIGNCGPSTPSCFNVEVQEIPFVDFDSPDIICEDETAFIIYNGIVGPNTVLNWNFGNGSVVNGNPDNGYFGLQLVEGQHIITLQVEENGCLSSIISKTIQVDPSILPPQITCNPTVDAIEFFWDPIPNVTSYLVNGQLQTETTFTINNLPPNEPVSITVEAISTNYCPNSFSEINCTTLDCPEISINIQSVQNFCSNDLPLGEMELEVEVLGTDGNGILTWSGPGIVDYINCIFDPSSDEVTIGTNEIIFTYQEGYCTYSEILIINISEAPQSEAGESLVLTCAESEQTINGSGSGIPFWEGPGILSGENTFSPTIIAPGIYTLTINDITTGCSSTDLVEIFEDFNIPTAIVGEDQMFTCDITECVLTSIGNTQINLIPQWEGPGINLSNVNSPTPLVDVPGTYILTILNTDNGCISEPESVLVSQNIEPPIAEIIIVGIFDCMANSVVLKPAFQDDVVYEWTTPDGTTIIDLSIVAFEEGIYTLVATNLINGCFSIEEILVEDLSDFPLADAGTDKEITCNLPEVVLDGTNSDTGPNIQFSWSGPVGGIVGPSDQNQAVVTIGGMYILTITNISNGCFAHDTVYVVSNIVAPVVDAGPELQFGCNDNALILTGTSSSDADEFMWQSENGNFITTSLVAEINTPGWYFFTTSNSTNGCFSVDSVFISEIVDLPYQINAHLSGETCFGEGDGFIEIENVLGGTPPFLYSIDNQGFAPITFWQNLESGTYKLTVQDALGCTFEQTFIVPETLPLELDLGPDINLELGQNLDLNLQTNISENSIETVIWSPSEVIHCLDENCLNISLNPLNTTILQVTLTDIFGCVAEDEIVVRVKKGREVYIPNVFSPNNDGFNDEFELFAGKDVQEFRNLKIFNRWGELVFDLPKIEQGNGNSYSSGWDGTLKGEPLNPGVFIYMIEVVFKDGHNEIYKGDITLVR